MSAFEPTEPPSFPIRTRLRGSFRRRVGEISHLRLRCTWGRPSLRSCRVPRCRWPPPRARWRWSASSVALKNKKSRFIIEAIISYLHFEQCLRPKTTLYYMFTRIPYPLHCCCPLDRRAGPSKLLAYLSAPLLTLLLPRILKTMSSSLFVLVLVPWPTGRYCLRWDNIYRVFESFADSAAQE